MLFGLHGGLGQEKMPLMPYLDADDEIVGNAFGGYYNPGALGLDNVSKILFMIYVWSSGRPVLILYTRLI